MKLICTIAWSALAILAAAANPKILYENDFQRAKIGQIPEDFLVLDGQFAVQQAGVNKFLELPGEPLDTYGALFGPTLKEDVAVRARIQSEKKGRRFPVFGIGLNGWGGYRLQIAPSKKALELWKGDAAKASAPYPWEPGQWSVLQLQVRKVKEGEWKVEGKAWTEGKGAPAEWLISWKEKEEPKPGRASIVGSPFSGVPIRFDDLVVSKAEEK